ncbi:AAA family ATPase [Ancylothrix sp. C2]|uniref:AAA family ATPase n=1 Tax=Ancylothrix sp. D3o TaxID=2953691 RepID=UPI0021BAF494|nr:AAA family ATPase [Ancylothrix sp. D3o]MCT7949358.1 AAA family ATPase [Ancylothrix sp. D3o]
MKLISIVLCNFRQFFGKTPEIKLAGGERNTTILHGNNGAGKTTLMNGFTWVLYERFTAAFAAEEQLVNKRALAEVEVGNGVACWVEVLFEHDHKRYRAQRICRAYKNADGGFERGKSELKMLIEADGGRWIVPPQPPEDIIGRILPESLHKYFFFDGERIEQIVRFEKKGEIAEATKELLGVEVLNRSIRHLGEAKKSLETDLRGFGDYETKKLLRDKQNFEQEVERLMQRQGEIQQELEDQGEIKKTIGGRRLELEGADNLQQLRNQLEGQKSGLDLQIRQGKNAIKRAISGRGYAVWLGDLTAEFRGLVGGLRASGELPVGIKQQFVFDLLERGKCICGADLDEGSHGRHLVEEWMEKAGAEQVEEAAIRMGVLVDDVDKQGVELWGEFDRQQAIINDCRVQLSEVENQLDDVKNKLRNFPDEDVSLLQRRLDDIDKKVSELNKELGSNEQQIHSLNGEITRLGKEIDKQRMQEIRQVLAQRRIAAAQDAIDRLVEVKNRLDRQFRLQLELRVQEIFRGISFTPYLPRLNEKYELTLVENVGDVEWPVAASTGENQILCLSFIGGIVDRVRDWSKRNTLMGPDSSTFPIVMDSPFGSLDEISRRRVANCLPKLANQLVVLVTKTQWRGEVAEEMASFIGREYVLVYYSSKPDFEEDFIELNGVRYSLVRQSQNEFDYTEIVEVERGNGLGF